MMAKHHTGKCKWCGQQQHDQKQVISMICQNCKKAGHLSVYQNRPEIKPYMAHWHSVFLGNKLFWMAKRIHTKNKSMTLLKDLHVPKHVRKTLVFHHVLADELSLLRARPSPFSNFFTVWRNEKCMLPPIWQNMKCGTNDSGITFEWNIESNILEISKTNTNIEWLQIRLEY